MKSCGTLCFTVGVVHDDGVALLIEGLQIGPRARKYLDATIFVAASKMLRHQQIAYLLLMVSF